MDIIMGKLGPSFSGQSPLVVDLNRFLAALAVRGLSSATARAYAYDLLAMCRWLDTTDINLYELSQPNLLDFICYRQNLDVHPTSINRELITIRSFYRFLTGEDIKSAPGALSVSDHYKGQGSDKYLGIHRLKRRGKINLRVKTPRTLIEPLSEEQVRAFLGSLRRYRDIAIVQLMLLCGLRSREILMLKVGDIDATERQVRILGKGGKQRLLPLPSILLCSLSDYMRFERPEFCDGDDLFVVLQGTRRGQAMSPAGLRSLFRYRREQGGVPMANAHRFRHTFGVEMVRNGVRLPILQRMMGHSSATTTLGYINLSLKDIAEEYSRASDAIRRKYGLTADTSLSELDHDETF